MIVKLPIRITDGNEVFRSSMDDSGMYITFCINDPKRIFRDRCTITIHDCLTGEKFRCKLNSEELNKLSSKLWYRSMKK
jgi:hypothetical protein